MLQIHPAQCNNEVRESATFALTLGGVGDLGQKNGRQNMQGRWDENRQNMFSGPKKRHCRTKKHETKTKMKPKTKQKWVLLSVRFSAHGGPEGWGPEGVGPKKTLFSI